MSYFKGFDPNDGLEDWAFGVLAFSVIIAIAIIAFSTMGCSALDRYERSYGASYDGKTWQASVTLKPTK